MSSCRPTRFGERVLSDSFYVWDIRGKRFNVTHLLDGLTEYHLGLVSKQFGDHGAHPEQMVCDHGAP